MAAVEVCIMFTFLKSLSDQGWYIGYTEDVYRRLNEHNSEKNASTHPRRPFTLIYYEAYLQTRRSRTRKVLKSGSGCRFLEKQMKNYLTP
jgi:putative endonuclease